MKGYYYILLGFTIFLIGTSSYAQQSVTSTGSSSIGSGGTLSDAIGQAAFTSISGVGGKAQEGVITQVNFPPDLSAIGPKNIDEKTLLTFTVSGNDVDGQAVTFSLDQASLDKGMTLDANSGLFNWTPTENQSVVHDVIFMVSDGFLIVSETVTITVNNLNEAPVLTAVGNKVIDELNNLTFSANATDGDFPVQALTFSLDQTAINKGMSIDGNTGAFSWTPAESQDGLHDATITVTDGILSDSETITITVSDVNSPPVLGAIGIQVVNITTNLAFTVVGNDTDIPTQSLTYSIDQPSIDKGMSIDANSGAFSWTPSAFQDGSHDVIFTVSDGTLSDSETVTIRVNTAPVLNVIGSQNADEETLLSFTVTGSDSDIPIQALTYSLDQTSIDKGMTIEPSTGLFNWIPSESQDGLHEVIFTVSDGSLTDSETVSITVNNVNVAPVLAAIGPQSVDEEVLLSFAVSGSDADIPSQTLVYSIDQTSVDKGMTIDLSTGDFNWTPTELQDGSHDVIFTVTDGTLSDSETVSVTVNNINIAPILNAIGPKSTNEEVLLNFTASGSDIDVPVQTLVFSLDQASLDKGMTINGSTGEFNWLPSESQDGLHDAVFTLSDGSLTDSETVNITVNNVNVAPILETIGPKIVDEEVLLNLTITGSDADIPDQTLTYSLDQLSLDKRMTIDASSGLYSWTPSESQDGVHDVVFSLSDGALNDTETVSITVNNINLPPVFGTINNGRVEATNEISFQITATDVDIPVQELSFSLDQASNGKGMVIGTSTGVFSWTPSEAQAGNHEIFVSVSDGITLTEASFSIVVDPVTTALLSISFQPISSPQPLIISVSGGVQPYTVIVKYKGLLESDFNEETLTESSPGNYSFDITSSMLDVMGLEFEVQVTDALENVDSDTGKIFVSFNEAQSPIIPFEKFGGTDESWNLFSVPYELENKTIGSIFTDYDPSRYEFDWKIMRYRNSSNDYVNFNTGQVKVGEAYWFNAKEQIQIKTGAGQTISVIPFPMTVFEGWNLIGNPYNVTISWNSVITSNGEDTNIESIYMFVPGTRNFQQGDIIQAFSGGFVWAEATTTVDISPVGNRSGSRIKNTEITNHNIDDSEWILPVSVNSDGFRYQQFAVGMHPEANEGKDNYDKMTLPRFFDYLEVYSTHEDYFYPWFSEDITASAEEQSWRFTIESGRVREKIQLMWDQKAIENNLSTLMLVDEQEGRTIDMKLNGGYEFALNSKRSFTIYYSLDPDKSILPASIFLGDAYPNPTNNSTAIHITLPDTYANYNIELSIYNVQGQKVQTIIKGGHEPGFYEYQWDVNESLPAGIYLYRLSFKDNPITPTQKRMIIQR